MISKKRSLFATSIIALLLGVFACKKEPPIQIAYYTVNVGENINVQKIHFVNSSVGYVCGGRKEEYGAIFKTIDGGNSWQKIYSSAINCIYDIAFRNDTLGFACGENLLLLKTVDGGQIWIDQQSVQGQPPASFNSVLRSICCVDDQTIYVAGGTRFEIGLTYKTYDAGGFWIYNTFENEFRDVCFIDRYNGYFAGYGRILKTNDSANSFQPLDIGNEFFTSLVFPTTNLGYACGYNGGIYKTYDGGIHWQEKMQNNSDLPRNRHFNGIAFVNASKGYVVGNNGLIMTTTDGGASWDKIKPFTSDNLFSVTIKNQHEILVASSSGNIYVLQPD